MAKQLLDAAAENENLQKFLTTLDFLREELQAEAEDYKLDYSLDSLGELERFMQDEAEIIAWGNTTESAVRTRMYIWVYIAETFRKSFGGDWIVSLDDPKNVNYGKWVIKGFDTVGVEFDPVRTMKAFLLRGKPHIRSMMEAHANPVPLDLSHLPEED